MKIENKLIDDLINESASISKTNYKNVMSRNRERKNIEARQMIFGILKDSGWGWSEIGKVFDKNHASIINSYKSHQQDYSILNYYKNDYDRLKRKYLSSHNEEIDLDIENKLLSQIEKLKNENGRLKDKIYDFKQTSKKLSKLINQI